MFAALGFAAFALPGEGGTYWTTYFPAITLLGIGGVFFVAPLTTTVFNAVSTEESGTASGVNNAVARTAGLLAIAGFGIVLSGAFAQRLNAEISGAHLTPQTIGVVESHRGQLFAGGVPPEIKASDRPLVAQIVRDSFLAGFRAVMAGSVVLCLLAALIAAFFIPGRQPVPAEAAAATVR